MKRIVTLGEIMVRFSPPRPKTLKQSNQLDVYYGGAEANVAVALSNLENEAVFLTALPDNAIGDAVISFLKGEGVDTSAIVRDEKRVGTYLVEEGTAQRPTKVTYDRSYSSFSTLDSTQIDWDAVFHHTDILHTTGITLALTDHTRELAYEAVEEAKKRDILVSFDFNYRSKLWSYEQAKQSILQILPYVDICFGSELDLINILERKSSGLSNINEQAPIDLNLYQSFLQDYQIEWMVTSVRQPETNTHHSLFGTAVNQAGQQFLSPEYDFEIVDRVGGGDAFAAGFLDKFRKNESDVQDAINFAAGMGVLQHSVPGDAFVLTREDVEGFIKSQKGTGVIR
ncbi:sugar kinase [Alteribacillus sp. YIM 98480]|uniref:sugar kinase n=1 Tax=Alteribacillus sp. YIM 98480 TaxID=2606599 RepID=UPI00131A85AC|nr:sugar kinase [Alteribacillus sp. YIM 98480]